MTHGQAIALSICFPARFLVAARNISWAGRGEVLGIIRIFAAVMRKFMFVWLLLAAAVAMAGNPKREFRGAWIQSVNG